MLHEELMQARMDLEGERDARRGRDALYRQVQEELCSARERLRTAAG